MSKKKASLIKAQSRLFVLVTISENIKHKTYQSCSLIYETILTYSVELVFNISDKS